MTGQCCTENAFADFFKEILKKALDSDLGNKTYKAKNPGIVRKEKATKH